jgi:hypothetical protein
MADRLASLRRIEAVQKQMVRLSDWRLALAQQACRDLEADRERLRGYIVGEGALGVPLAKAALNSLDTIEKRRAAAIAKRDAEIGRRDALRLRETVVARMTEEAALDARRAEEDRDLKTTMEAWLVARDASLP